MSAKYAAALPRIETEAESAAHFRKMFDRVSSLAGIGVWECDLATEALTWTDAVYDLFDVPRGAPLRRAELVECYEPASRAEMERLRAAAARDGTGFRTDVRIRTRLGREKWIRLTAEVELEDGRPVRIFGTKQDVSAEKAAQSEIQALQSELIHVSRVSAMSTMASALAHELNQPLAAIANYMAAARRLAEGEPVSDGLAECLEAAGTSAHRAGEIIRRLRAVTAPGEAGKLEFDIAEAAREAVALATAGDVETIVACDLAGAPPVQADRVQVQQVLINLIQNAREAVESGPCRIEIGAGWTASQIELCVADSGPGIAGAMLPRIFDSFATTKAGGMGVGLSIARTIVEAHGGRIRAGNRPGGGAEFRFTLPLSRSED